jgi:hypothetical protein
MDWLQFGLGCVVFAVVLQVTEWVFDECRLWTLARRQQRQFKKIFDEAKAMATQPDPKTLCRACNKNERVQGKFLCATCTGES